MSFLQRFQQLDSSKASGIAIVLVLTFAFFSFTSLQSLLNTTKKVKHTESARFQAAQIEKLVVDLEAGQRGFLITGADEYLEPYNIARDQLNSAINNLKDYVSDDADQQLRLQEIDNLLRHWLHDVGSLEVSERRKVAVGAKDAVYLQKVLSRGVGKNILDKIRVDLKQMDDMFSKANNDEARNLVLQIAKDLVGMESGQRGFLVTGKDEFLEPFYDGQDDFGVHVANLYSVIDNAFDAKSSSKLIKSLQFNHGQWHKFSANPLIESRIAVDNNVMSKDDLADEVEKKNGGDLFILMHDQLKELSKEFEKSNNVKSAYLIAQIGQSMYAQESGLRGFLLTGNSEFLDDFNQGEEDFNEYLFKLQVLISNAFDKDVIQRKLAIVANQAQQWKDKSAEPEIAAREEMNVDKTTMQDVIDLMKEGRGKSLMDQIRLQFLDFKSAEEKLLSSREKSFKKTSLLMVSLLVISSLFMIFFALVLMRITKRLKIKSKDVEIEKRKLMDQDWIKSSIVNISESIQNEKNVQDFSDVLLSELIPLIDSQIGLFYIRHQDDDKVCLNLLASVAHTQRKHIASSFQLGEGLVGQCALEQKQIVLTDIPEDYIKIVSGLGKTSPKTILVMPIIFESRILAVIEIASLNEFNDLQVQFFQQLQQSLGVITNNIITQQKTEKLLDNSRKQSQLLADNQQSLQRANEDLGKQTVKLKQSEEELKQQSEELRVSNEELTEKQSALEIQKRALEKAKSDVENKADELQQSSKYKSEFLANMSHELRTPLNSLLILSKLLMQNKVGNLTEAQCEDLKVIHDGGNDLLELINDIMDLSKVEAGMLSVHFESVRLLTVIENIKKVFSILANDKGLTFICDVDRDLPETIHSDGQRLEQILKNFLSNAFKFTAKGTVRLHIHRVADDVRFTSSKLTPISAVALSVEDSGVGIAPEKQQAIFEAFQQEDGSTSRKYGGTGLGLAISKELSSLLGGEIFLSSEQGQGSTFTVYLPMQHHQSGASDAFLGDHKGEKHVARNVEKHTPEAKNVNEPKKTAVKDENVEQQQLLSCFIEDDRRNIIQGDKVILLVEDDKSFASILLSLAREGNFKCLVTDKGREALYLAQEFNPVAILLDVGLPDIDGLEVLDQLKYNLHTRHIPVHIVSGSDFQDVSLKRGAYRYLHKPIDVDVLTNVFEGIHCFDQTGEKNILVIEDDESSQIAIQRLIAYDQVKLQFAVTGAQALQCLEQKKFDCVILDLGLPDMSEVDVLEQMAKNTDSVMPPVIIYTGQDIPEELEARLTQLSTGIIIKGAESSERLLDEVSLFLHSVSNNLPEEQKEAMTTLHDEDAMLKGRKVLLVDDDMRNVFALSRQLEMVGIDVCMADNGQVALDMLNDRDDIELVLMDIMMPVMDGYEACREIRQIARYQHLPIIALTAKAMAEDRDKCIEAGASEYLTKPVDLDKLLSMLRVWLYKHG